MVPSFSKVNLNYIDRILNKFSSISHLTELGNSWILNSNFIEDGKILRLSFAVIARTYRRSRCLFQATDLLTHLRDQNFESFPSCFTFGLLFAGS